MPVGDPISTSFVPCIPRKTWKNQSTIKTDSYTGHAEKAEAVAKVINESGGTAVAIPGDMLDSAYIDTLVKKAAEFGGGKIHIIVNNAGFTWDGVIHKVNKFENIILLLTT